MDTITKASELLRACVGMPWCQEFYAYDKDGKTCGAWMGEAVTFCSLGRIQNKANGQDNRIALEHEAELALAHVLGVSNVPNWNDAPGRTQAEVDDAFLLAASYLEAKGK